MQVFFAVFSRCRRSGRQFAGRSSEKPQNFVDYFAGKFTNFCYNKYMKNRKEKVWEIERKTSTT